MLAARAPPAGGLPPIALADWADTGVSGSKMRAASSGQRRRAAGGSMPSAAWVWWLARPRASVMSRATVTWSGNIACSASWVAAKEKLEDT